METSNTQDTEKWFESIDTGNIAEIKNFLKIGFDINYRDSSGKTALIIAASKGNIGLVEFLFINSSDINIKDNDYKTAFDYASANEHKDIANLLSNKDSSNNSESSQTMANTSSSKSILKTKLTPKHIPIFIIVIISVVLLAYFLVPFINYKMTMASGDKYYESQNLDPAMNEYQKALTIYPQDLDAYYMIGAIYNKNGRFKEAIEKFTFCFEKKFKIKETSEKIALTYFDLLKEKTDYAKEDWDKLNELFKTALEYNPNNTVLKSYMDNIYDYSLITKAKHLYSATNPVIFNRIAPTTNSKEADKVRKFDEDIKIVTTELKKLNKNSPVYKESLKFIALYKDYIQYIDALLFAYTPFFGPENPMPLFNIPKSSALFKLSQQKFNDSSIFYEGFNLFGQGKMLFDNMRYSEGINRLEEALKVKDFDLVTPDTYAEAKKIIGENEDLRYASIIKAPHIGDPNAILLIKAPDVYTAEKAFYKALAAWNNETFFKNNENYIYGEGTYVSVEPYSDHSTKDSYSSDGRTYRINYRMLVKDKFGKIRNLDKYEHDGDRYYAFRDFNKDSDGNWTTTLDLISTMDY